MKMLRAIVCGVVILGGALAQTAPDVSKTPNPGLVGQLTSQLNITPAQATGGAGAIFGVAKQRLSPAEFSKLAAAVPGMNGFLKAAPAPEGGAALGSVGSMAPAGAGGLGAAASGKTSGVASLAGSFQKLKLSPSMVSQFTPVLQNYIQKRGGSSTAALFAGALK